jgi:hypothetical protein
MKSDMRATIHIAFTFKRQRTSVQKNIRIHFEKAKSKTSSTAKENPIHEIKKIKKKFMLGSLWDKFIRKAK